MLSPVSRGAFYKRYCGKMLLVLTVLLCCPSVLTACSAGPAINPGSVPLSQPETNSHAPQVKYAEVLSAEETWKHIGEVRTVRYSVGNPYRSARGNVFLNEKQDYKTGFTTVIFATVAQTFGDPLTKYGHRTIEVTGLIRMYEGHPEIIVNIPTEIVIIK